MYSIDDEPIVEDIFIPQSLLNTVSRRENAVEGAHRAISPSDHPSNQTDEIHIQKRNHRTISWATKVADRREAPQRAASYSSVLEEGRRQLHQLQGPSVPPHIRGITSSLHLNWSDSIHPPQFLEQDPFSDSSVHVSRIEQNSRSPLPLPRLDNVARKTLGDSVRSVYNRANLVKIKHQRRYWIRLLIEYSAYTTGVAFVYFVLVGRPLWKGAVYWLYWVMQRKFVFAGGWAIFIFLLVFYSFAPLLLTFENDFPGPDYYQTRRIGPTAPDTALLIPCYKSGSIVGRTLEAALKIFPASQVYVIANGNSPTPLDNTEEVCKVYGVNHIWCPVGSKIVAIFIGCHAVKSFRHVLLIDDDCILPPHFPVVVSRLTEKVRCIGYTIKSVGPNSLPGSYCQQAQDLEYKLAGLQRSFAGRIGSATFPHGAISLWQRAFLKETLQHHPGFSISEDWFMGNSCRRLGGRIQMCSAVFVETTAPAALVFVDRNSSRGGFGEMTVFKQRFLRWNFFVANGICYNLLYLFGSWKLGKWELGAKLFVIQEVYESLLYVLTPFILPIGFVVRPVFCGALLGATVALYLFNAIIFNEFHLRLKDERIEWNVVLWYYMPYKIFLGLTNVASCYYSLFKYARYFAKRRPKLTEDHKAVGMVLRLEEIAESRRRRGKLGRRMTVRSLGVRKKNDSLLVPVVIYRVAWRKLLRI
ncbi:glycosyltransferase like family 2-domain-containing protein [Aspergillus pseudonomiae]|uniref:Glycosyltransferase like family 2-domain-containing protein n=1 Tax=Aspergillus pseudonomiae TaxID=1506151 RepID=A0A5N7CUH9_9EURO|nr:glycosyltransferase like family 2-domain-containing protein [Aspergillus pseudonomiae]KAB8254483.1 glycosyltransferase like family 2-domain-containing protein [Aspergillus pseudonomiae]KAE8397855.1 glycosyltransferase like family 2-domain-containing protein [Aspergillus pseudonomiae]